jgi:pyruvate ferredoxin oxidoreductase beta subunit
VKSLDIILRRRKNLLYKVFSEQIVAAHGDVYIATASSAYPEDLLAKVRKAKSLDKPSFIHIICPCSGMGV